MYRSSHELLEITAPLVASTLEGGGHVVVLSRRWYAAALREALGDDAGNVGLVDYRAARVLSHDAPADLGEQLGSTVHPDRPTLVISQFVRPTAAPPARPFTVLPPRSTTLLCVCPLAAHDDLRGSFYRAHQHRVESPPPVPRSLPLQGPEGPAAVPARPPRTSPSPATPRATPTVQVAFGTVDDLSAARAQVARAAATAGFGIADRARAVLAVHEAMVLACTLVLEDADVSAAARPCRLQAYARPARLVAEIDLPRSIAFPAGQRDRDPLADTRAFCHEVSWFGSLRTRHIRVVALG